MAGAVVDRQGEILCRMTIASHGDDEPLKRLIGLIRDLVDWVSRIGRDSISVLGVGLGVPGVVHTDRNTVSLCPGLGWEKLAIGDLVRDEIGLPVWLDNDLNAITLGEACCGSLQGISHGICVAVGTGLGAGIQINGEIYRGVNGASGEIGLWVLNKTSSIEPSSGYGSLESFVAGPGILRRAVELSANSTTDLETIAGPLHALTAEDVFAAAARGDESASRIVRDTTTALGIAVANIALLMDVQRIVFTGGVTQTGEQLLEPVRKIVNQLVPFAPEIVHSTLGLDAGVLGSAYGLLKAIDSLKSSV